MVEAIIWVRKFVLKIYFLLNNNNFCLYTDIESPEIISQKPTDQTFLSDKTKEKKPPTIDEPLRNKTTELEGLDMSNLPKVEETKIENSNLTKNEGEKVGISSQNINNILIGKSSIAKEKQFINKFYAFFFV